MIGIAQFPIKEINVAAAMLRAQRNLRLINEFLNEHDLIAVELLSKSVGRFVRASYHCYR
jgi:hypothetical protein